MRFKVWLDEKQDLLRIDTYEKLTKDDYQAMIDEIESTLDGKDIKKVLGDMSSGHAPGTLDKEARQLFKEHASALEFDKIALIGATPSIRMISKIVFFVIGRTENAKFFKTEEEAINWLKVDGKK